eukprot:jgi/Tetstr1/437555/TSEL_026227.t1
MAGTGEIPMAALAERATGLSSEIQEDAASSSASMAVPADPNTPGPSGLGGQPAESPQSPAPAKKTAKKKWGKVRIMAAVQGTVADVAETMREEAKRQMQLRMEARKKMEMRTRLFQDEGAEYDSMEYLPGMHRAETFVDEQGLKRAASTLTGADGILRSTTMSMVPQKQAKDQGVNEKTRLVFAALRGKLPQKTKQEDDLVAQATDDIALDVALEETANVQVGKDGSIYKKYTGIDQSTDSIMATMKRDIFGRSVRPWKFLSKSERSWLIASWMYVAYDFVAIIFFAYLAIFLFANDTKMDPLAWQLAFGTTAVFTTIHMLYLVFQYIEYFAVWLMFVVCLTVGLFYGGVNYFLEIYTGEFTCFHSSGVEQHAFGVCYEGRLLLGMMLGCLSLLLSALFLWQWRIHKRLQLKRRGEFTEKLDLEELLEQVDMKFEKYKLLGGKDFVSDSQPGSDVSATSGVGSPKNGIASVGTGTKPDKPRFLSRMLSPAKGVNQNMTSTALRGSAHAVTQEIQMMPPGTAKTTGSAIGSSPVGTTMRPRLLGRSASGAMRDEEMNLDRDNESELQMTVGRMKQIKYLPPIRPTLMTTNKPTQQLPAINPFGSPTKKISVAQASKARSSKSLLVDGMPSIAPLERNTTFARKSMRKMNVAGVSNVLNSGDASKSRSLVKRN